MPPSLTRRQIELLALIQGKPSQLGHEDLSDELHISIPTLNREIEALNKAGMKIQSRMKKPHLKEPLKPEQYQDLLSNYLSASSHVIGFPKSIVNICKKLKEKTLIIFRSIVQAIEHRKVLAITYKKQYYGEIVQRKVEPYDIIPTFNDWRLIAYSDGIYKQFLIENIQAIAILEERFNRIESYDLNNIFRNSITYWTGDEEYEVVLRVNRSAANIVQDTIWSEHQEVKKLPGGKIHLMLKVNSIPDIGNWVMGWGGAIEVIKPNELRRFIKKQANGILKAHQNKSN